MIGALVAALLTVPSPRVVAGPYLQQVGETSAVVVWSTDVPTFGQVRFGGGPNQLDRTVDAPGENTTHVVTLPALDPDTRYVYAIGTPADVLAGGDEGHAFETAPPEGAPFRVWIVGDTAGADEHAEQARDASLLWGWPVAPDLALHLGGMSDGVAETLARYDPIVRRIGLWPAAGSGQVAGGEISAAWRDAFVLPAGGELGGVPSEQEAWYSFDYGDLHVVVLDSAAASRATDGPMLRWLEEDLAANTRRWTVAAFHHAPYARGRYDADLTVEHVEMRENALPILEAAGVDLVLGAHAGLYQRSYLLHGAYGTPATTGVVDGSSGEPHGNGPYVKEPGGPGTLYVVCGHGGDTVSEAGDHPLIFLSDLVAGACVLDVTSTALTVSDVRRDGAVGDRVTLMKGPGLVLVEPNGGEVIASGIPRSVRWIARGVDGTVTVEASYDGGETWSAAGSAPAAAGELTWAPPGRSAIDARLRISGEGGVRDHSDGAFVLKAGAPLLEIPFGAAWRVHSGGEDPGLAFVSAGYDDSAWSEVPAPVTEAAGATLFARHIATLEELPSAGWVDVRHDDGAVVWVNGQEVLRRDVGDLAAGAFAWRPGAPAERTRVALPIRLGGQPFVKGENVVAVMVKRATSDGPILFDASMTLLRRGADVPIPFEPDDAPDEELQVIAPDAGPAVSVEHPPEPPSSGGCGATGPPSAPWWLGLGLLLALRRRRLC